MDDGVSRYPRLWWTKRLLLCAIALLVLLTVARFLWGWYAHRQLQNELNRLAVAGEPLTVEQITPHDVAAEDNSAPWWKRAIAAINPQLQTPSQSDLSYSNYPPYPGEWVHLLETGVPGNAQAIALAEQAATKPATDWGIQISVPFNPGMLAPLNSVRNLANVVGDSATWSHLHGNDAEALHRIVTVRRLGRSMHAEPLLIAYMVGIGIDALAMERLQEIAPDLAIGNSSAAASSATTQSIAASRQQVRQLIGELLHDAADRSDVHQAIVFERVEQLETIRKESHSAWLLGPMFDLEMLRAFRSMQIVLHAIDSSQYFAPEMAILNTVPGIHDNFGFTSPSLFTSVPQLTMPSQPPRYSRIVSATLGLNWIDRFLITDNRVREDREFAAVSLATRLYWLDHQAWPKSLDDLVPDYLPQKPIDLFSPTGAPLGYLVGRTPGGNGERPVVYGVDSDAKQFAAPKAADLPVTPQFGYGRRNLWQFRDLSRWYPPTPTQPTTSP